jgi:hypothetical protein
MHESKTKRNIWKTVYLDQVHVHPARKLQGFMPGDNVVSFIRDEPDEGSGDGVVHAVAFVLLLASLLIDLQNRDGTEQIITRPPTISALARQQGKGK